MVLMIGISSGRGNESEFSHLLGGTGDAGQGWDASEYDLTRKRIVEASNKHIPSRLKKANE